MALALLASSLIWRAHQATGPVLPAGSRREQGWTLVPKTAAGLGPGSSFASVASTGSIVLLAGETSANNAMIWRSDDGLHWSPARVPAATGGVTAISISGQLALAIGSGGPATSFVWRSSDGGTSWRQLAQGTDLFGPPAPQMGRPFVTGLSRYRGSWVASGGASTGYAGIWVSTDGTSWTQALGPNQAGSADVVEGAGGELFAYWVTSIWTARAPAAWTAQTAVTIPDPFSLESVAPGATLAVAGDRGQDGPPSPPATLLRSDNGGRTWTVDPGPFSQFPDAAAWTLTRADGVWVAAGYSGRPNHPDAWVSTDAVAWAGLPSPLYGGPGGTLSLIGDVDGRIVLAGTAPELDHFYVFQPPMTPAPSPAVPLQSVDWNAVVYPIVPPCGTVGSRLGDVAYATPAPGVHLAIVTASCNAGAGSPPSAVFVFDRASSPTLPHLLQILVDTQEDWHADDGIRVTGSSLSIPVAGYSGAVPRCCPDIHTTLTWKWDASSYRETSTEPAHAQLPR